MSFPFPETNQIWPSYPSSMSNDGFASASLDPRLVTQYLGSPLQSTGSYVPGSLPPFYPPRLQSHGPGIDGMNRFTTSAPTLPHANRFCFHDMNDALSARNSPVACPSQKPSDQHIISGYHPETYDWPNHEVSHIHGLQYVHSLGSDTPECTPPCVIGHAKVPTQKDEVNTQPWSTSFQPQKPCCSLGIPGGIPNKISDQADTAEPYFCRATSQSREGSAVLSSTSDSKVSSSSTAPSGCSKLDGAPRLRSIAPATKGPRRRTQNSIQRLQAIVNHITPQKKAGSISFPCALARYGCKATFVSKNEWKRHMRRQHMRLDVWRCELCPEVLAKPNDFHRKDLFQQHVRRMHSQSRRSLGPKKQQNAPSLRLGSSSLSEQELSDLTKMETRCHIRIRGPPERSCCLFCPREFDGPGSWDERMEHISLHLERFERDNRCVPNVTQWREDAALEEWLRDEGMIVKYGEKWRLAGKRRHGRWDNLDVMDTIQPASRQSIPAIEEDSLMPEEAE
ncbi:hypothetical protein K461DRAFT_295596 [Myriangium duriaei CBS 260.36]|uniref:C2H2-type domain-containing protein n=1 Tax=Myriangium duriaei CBS 260.36 TaxID=1168546 RepID=A0A9P4IXJ6_9PEZI|nr:hypothetical protein K461DRAFT_295596 [Myriangium duriaei CBS 260.36]